MTKKKIIFVIIGSAGNNSANEKLIDHIAFLSKSFFNLAIFKELKSIPHFDPGLSVNNPPKEVIEFRTHIENADGILICTPEYVFSLPAGLKNAIEWCVSATVFMDKPAGLITASANGRMGHEELQLIMKTVGAKFTDKTTLLIQGIKGKVSDEGIITDEKTTDDLIEFLGAFSTFVNRNRRIKTGKFSWR